MKQKETPIRISDAERAAIESKPENAGLSFSNVVRLALGLPALKHGGYRHGAQGKYCRPCTVAGKMHRLVVEDGKCKQCLREETL